MSGGAQRKRTVCFDGNISVEADCFLYPFQSLCTSDTGGREEKRRADDYEKARCFLFSYLPEDMNGAYNMVKGFARVMLELVEIESKEYFGWKRFFTAVLLKETTVKLENSVLGRNRSEVICRQ